MQLAEPVLATGQWPRCTDGSIFVEKAEFFYRCRPITCICSAFVGSCSGHVSKYYVASSESV